MNLAELNKRLKQLLEEAKPLAIKSNDGELTADEDTRFNELVESINEVRQDIAKAEERRAASDSVIKLSGDMSKGVGSAARSLDAQVGDEVEKRKKRMSFRNPGKRFVQSDSFKRYAAAPSGVSGRELMGSTYFADDGTDADYREGDGPIDVRALVHGGSFVDGGINYIQSERLPGIVSGTPFPLRVRDVLTNGRTNSPSIEFVRKLSGTNNAAEVAEATAVNTAAAKPESAVDLEIVTTSVKTIAHWIPVTRQMLQDAAQIQTFIEAELLLGLEKREDTQLVNGNGSGANLTGILNTSGVQSLDSTSLTTSPMPADFNQLDLIRRAVKMSRVTGEANPNFVFAHPDDVEVWDTIKDEDGNYLLRSGGPEAGGVRSIWGLTIVETLAVAAKTALVGDGRYAIVLDKMDGQIFMTDSHDDWFTKNLIAILAESRLALAVTLPAAFVEVDLTAENTSEE